MPEDFKTGSIFETNSWGKVRVLEWHHHKKVLVEFLNTGNTDFHSAGDIRRKEVMDRKAYEDVRTKVGDKFTSNDGQVATIIHYENNRNVTVRFDETGYEMTTHLNNIRSGRFKDATIASVYGVGFLGIKMRSKPDPLNLQVWVRMLQRCYDPNSQYYYLYGGSGVSVCEEWHNFQNFSNWAIAVKFREDKWHIDKDIIHRGNKVYCPDFCSFVPGEVNSIVVDSRNKTVGSGLPPGVDFSKKLGKYRARICLFGKTRNLGFSDDPMELFLKYKAAKEETIKILAEKYRNRLDPRVYESLMNWEITP